MCEIDDYWSLCANDVETPESSSMSIFIIEELRESTVYSFSSANFMCQIACVSAFLLMVLFLVSSTKFS